MTAARVKMGTNGRLVVPAVLHTELGLTGGMSVLAETVDGELRVQPMESAFQRAQVRLQQLLDGITSLSRELIADRQAEASRKYSSTAGMQTTKSMRSHSCCFRGTCPVPTSCRTHMRMARSAQRIPVRLHQI